jgi:hypothetical protein
MPARSSLAVTGARQALAVNDAFISAADLTSNALAMTASTQGAGLLNR